MSTPIRVTVWNEFCHENPQRHADVKSRLRNSGSARKADKCNRRRQKIYPEGMHAVIANHLR